MYQYDYLVVGSGLFGSVFTYHALKKGKKVLVIDKRPHVGGNVFTETIEGITVHRYGAHVFHTSDKEVWDFVCRFAEFNNFVNCPVANYKGQLYNLPFNMNTFSKLWGVVTPKEAQEKICSQTSYYSDGESKNLEEQALRLVGSDIYEKIIKGYTEKQWGRPCRTLPASIIRRLPCRFTFDNNYFSDRYQGVPIGGYTPIIQKLLCGADIMLRTDYFDFVKKHPGVAHKTIYTGMIDEFFGYIYGKLEYRTLNFEIKTINQPN